MELGTNALLVAKRLWGKIKSGPGNFEAYMSRLKYLMSEFPVTWKDLGTDEVHAKRIIKRNVLVLIGHYAMVATIPSYTAVAAYNIKRLLKEYELSETDPALADIELPKLPSDDEMGPIEILHGPEAAA